MNKTKSCPDKGFLNRFFHRLKEYRIRYAVLRNWETLPDSLGNSDLDLLTDSADNANKIIEHARHTANELGGDITSIYTVEATVMTLAGKKGDGTWWGLHIDIFPELTYFGIPYFSASIVLDQAVLEKDQFYRCTGLGNVVAFLKECLHNRQTKKDYYKLSQISFKNDPESVISALSGYYRNQEKELVINLLKQEHTPKEIRHLSHKLIRSLWMKNLLSIRPFQLISIKIRNFFKRFKRIFKPPGYCVAFLGTDGAGKSTIIDAIRPFLTKMMHHDTIYEHLRPNCLPPIAQLFGKPEINGPTTDPHAGKVSGFPGSAIRLLYYLNDYIFGYWLKIYPLMIKRPTMIIFDRYFYDYLIDPKRSCIDLPSWIIRFISIFVPSPDLIICLGTDPKTINTRKPELPYHEAARQIKALRHFCENNKRAVWIDTGGPAEKSIDQSIQTITTKMSGRYEK